MAGTFEVYEDKAGKFRFRLKAGSDPIGDDAEWILEFRKLSGFAPNGLLPAVDLPVRAQVGRLQVPVRLVVRQPAVPRPVEAVAHRRASLPALLPAVRVRNAAREGPPAPPYAALRQARPESFGEPYLG